MSDYTYKVLDRENIVVGSSVATFTPAKLTEKVAYAQVQVQFEPIRITEDGTDPDPANHIGSIFYPGAIFEVWGREARQNFKMVKEGFVDSRVEVTYMGVE